MTFFLKHIFIIFLFIVSYSNLLIGQSKLLLFDSISNAKIFINADTSILSFNAGMAIDADGSPRAYCAADTGLDYLKNAGVTGNWWALACDSFGKPYIQSNTDVYPGFYISTTSLVNARWKENETQKYVDAENYPYIALPQDLMKKAKINLGDISIVIRGRDTAFAIVADTGPPDKLGEGSIALAEALNIPSSPKNGGIANGITYIIYPGSGRGNGIIPKKMEVKLKAYNLTNAFLASQRALK